MPGLIQATLGQDFGCHATKLSLAFRSPVTGRPECHRVPLKPGLDHVERVLSPNAANSQFEFIALAAQYGNGLVPGRRSLHRDHNFPLKTIFTYRCGVKRESTMLRLPGGRELLQRIKQGTITSQMMEDVLLEHFTLLYEMATTKAADFSPPLEITSISLTYPNFLWAREQEGDYEKYATYYRHLMQKVWSQHNVQFEMISEGQAAALYVCEPFSDPLCGSRAALWDAFKDIPRENGLNMIIPDCGGSTLNIQVVTVYFDESGSVSDSQSAVGSSWRPGTQGGSHLSNDSIKEVIQERLSHLQVGPGELAALVENFEQNKWGLNWVNLAEPIVLTGLGSRRTVVIHAAEIKEAFHKAFANSLIVVKREVARLLRLQQHFVVTFCGGSNCNPGVREIVDGYMKGVRDKAAKNGIIVRWTYLANFDLTWVSAVSVGAAVSMLRLTPPLKNLRGAAIGLQMLHNAPHTREYVGWSSSAPFLFSMGCGRLPHFDIDLARTGIKKTRMKFALVCDPGYLDREAEAVASGTFPMIPIGREEDVLLGPRTVYDIGWAVKATDLPRGRVRFRLSGTDIECLAADPTLFDDREEKIILEIMCYKINTDGEMVGDKLDKCWQLALRTDPASKNLNVGSEVVMPMWCDCCKGEIQQRYHECQLCQKGQGYNLCWSCYEDIDTKHESGHNFKELFIDL